MTEEEARTKWCPMVRLSCRNNGHISNAFNKWFGTIKEGDIKPNPVILNCIASDCAMWVQTDNEADPKPCGDEEADNYYPAGHCGLIKGYVI